MCYTAAYIHSLVSERESFLHPSGWGKSQRRAQPLFLVTEFPCVRKRSLPHSVKLWNHRRMRAVEGRHGHDRGQPARAHERRLLAGSTRSQKPQVRSRRGSKCPVRGRSSNWCNRPLPAVRNTGANCRQPDESWFELSFVLLATDHAP